MSVSGWTMAIVSASLATVSIAAQVQAPATTSTPSSEPPPAAQALAKAKTQSKNTTWKVPRTAWGEPDLQGVWSYATTTPLSKPESAGDKTFLTDEEVADLAERTARQQDAPPRPGD